jgi:hypothetical protein
MKVRDASNIRQVEFQNLPAGAVCKWGPQLLIRAKDPDKMNDHIEAYIGVDLRTGEMIRMGATTMVTKVDAEMAYILPTHWENNKRPEL